MSSSESPVDGGSMCHLKGDGDGGINSEIYEPQCTSKGEHCQGKS